MEAVTTPGPYGLEMEEELFPEEIQSGLTRGWMEWWCVSSVGGWGGKGGEQVHFQEKKRT